MFTLVYCFPGSIANLCGTCSIYMSFYLINTWFCNAATCIDSIPCDGVENDWWRGQLGASINSGGAFQLVHSYPTLTSFCSRKNLTTYTHRHPIKKILPYIAISWFFTPSLALLLNQRRWSSSGGNTYPSYWLSVLNATSFSISVGSSYWSCKFVHSHCTFVIVFHRLPILY